VCGIAACIPSTLSRKQPIPYDTAFYRQRHRNEAIFGKLKDWRRIATRYDRCAHTFESPASGMSKQMASAAGKNSLSEASAR
jgi:transposase